MVMRVGGIASGMDIEGMVEKLMEAERMPLIRLQQQQETLTWKRDAFRDINSKLLDLDNMMLDMKYSSTYKPKSAVSSNESAVTATATSSASNGSYEIKVEQLATSAISVSDAKIEKNVTFTEGKHVFITFDEKGDEIEHTLSIEEGDTLKDVLKNIGQESKGAVRAFYDETSQQVVMETTRTGQYNSAGTGEIQFGSGKLFTETFQMGEVKGGENAKFTYNNSLVLESKTNNYNLNGIDFTFHQTTDVNARISVSTDVEQSFDKIMKFVDTYNEAIDAMNKSQHEEKFRDYLPLTEEQKAEMSEDQIKKWEEKAKSGVLRGESTISNGMYSLRQSLQQNVETDGEYTLLSQIGITTTRNYLDGGKLEVDEEKLKTALRDNPDDVYKLFSNSEEGASRGLIHRFDDTLDRTRGSIEQKAGKDSHTLDNYQLGKNMKHLNNRMEDFQRRMVQVEQRYWSQFTAMEKAISQLNQQSANLLSQFGG